MPKPTPPQGGGDGNFVLFVIFSLSAILAALGFVFWFSGHSDQQQVSMPARHYCDPGYVQVSDVCVQGYDPRNR